MKDKETRESKGVAFILYVERTAAHKAISALNRKELFGRTIKVSIAKENGRTAEFIRRKTYRDKTRQGRPYALKVFSCNSVVAGITSCNSCIILSL